LTIYATPRCIPVGDTGLLVELADEISIPVNDDVSRLDRALEAAPPPGLMETVPTYRSMMLYFDPAITDAQTLAIFARDLLQAPPTGEQAQTRSWTVPVCYGGEAGQDLEDFARAKSLSPGEIIALHTGADYRVYMIGAFPGFTYLGGLNPALHASRKAVPIPRMPERSIMIGGIQAGIGTVPAPTGWHLLGRTPFRAYDPSKSQPFVLRVGDHIRFEAVSHDRWQTLEQMAEAGEVVATMDVA
jgi:KipI family sensor histidine kinase inhibitor